GEAAEVVLVRPVVGERLQRRQLHALGAVVDQLLARPACRLDAAAQVVDLVLTELDVEGTDVSDGLGGGAHCALGSRHGSRRSSSASAWVADSPKRCTHRPSHSSLSRKNFQSPTTPCRTNMNGTGDSNGRKPGL